MKLKLGSLIMAAGLAFNAQANDIMIDTSAIDAFNYDLFGPVIGNGDSNSLTGAFEELGFSATLATSIYDFSDGDLFGTFVDTNIPAELIAFGVPAAGVTGTALDGTSTVSLAHPLEDAETDIDALSPLAPPLGADSEGFLGTWYLDTEFYLSGTLGPTGPQYTGGYIEIFFQQTPFVGTDRISVLKANVDYSNINGVGLEIFFDIVEARAGFWQVQDAGGNFTDINNLLAIYESVPLRLDTNVDPPVPTADQLLLVNGSRGPQVVRQTNLDGSLRIDVPEPASLAILGLGLMGLGFSTRRNKKA